MDKARIYGVFEFVGFHLCKKLLEKGICVDGIHFSMDSELFLEEKRLEVGRNSNFFEAGSGDQRNSDVSIVSLYDWFMTFEKASCKEHFPKIIQILKEQDKHRLVLLLPIQLLTDGQDVEGIEDIKNFLTEIKEMNHSSQYIYLPTIFGPWQPSSFFFQQGLLHQNDEKFKMREWPLDAIYVDDLLNPMIDLIESGEEGDFLFESGIPKSWELCAEYLKLDGSIGIEAADVKPEMNVKKKVLTKVTPYKESLEAQKEHSIYVHHLLGKL